MKKHNCSKVKPFKKVAPHEEHIRPENWKYLADLLFEKYQTLFEVCPAVLQISNAHENVATALEVPLDIHEAIEMTPLSEFTDILVAFEELNVTTSDRDRFQHDASDLSSPVFTGRVRRLTAVTLQGDGLVAEIELSSNRRRYSTNGVGFVVAHLAEFMAVEICIDNTLKVMSLLGSRRADPNNQDYSAEMSALKTRFEGLLEGKYGTLEDFANLFGPVALEMISEADGGEPRYSLNEAQLCILGLADVRSFREFEEHLTQVCGDSMVAQEFTRDLEKAFH